MSELDIQRVYTDCTVADVASNETIAIYTVPKGYRVLWATAQILVAADGSTDSTWEIGDASDDNGFVTSFDTENTVGNYYGDAGAYLAASGGKLYNAATAVNAYYKQGSTDGATAPSIRVCLAIAPN